MKNGPYELVIAPENYPGKRYRGRYCYEHHLVWWQHHGTLPGPDELVHHKDENKRHNVIENLELMKKGRHATKHGIEKGRSFTELRCAYCGNIFVRETRSVSTRYKAKYVVCSKRCRGCMSGKGRFVDATRIEPQEIKTFRAVVAVASVTVTHEVGVRLPGPEPVSPHC